MSTPALLNELVALQNHCAQANRPAGVGGALSAYDIDAYKDVEHRIGKIIERHGLAATRELENPGDR